MTRMRIQQAAALVALAGLAACNNGGRSSSGDTASVASAPPPMSTPASAPPPAAPAACRTGDLSVAKVSSDAGAGQRYGTYAFVNTGPEACTLQGYPTVVLFDQDGQRADSVTAVQTEAAYNNVGGPPQATTLAPRGKAVFFTSFTGIQATDKPCVTVSRLQITPPGNTQAIELQDALSICTGQFRVSPVRRGSAAAVSSGGGSGAAPNNPNSSVFY